MLTSGRLVARQAGDADSGERGIGKTVAEGQQWQRGVRMAHSLQNAYFVQEGLCATPLFSMNEEAGGRRQRIVTRSGDWSWGDCEQVTVVIGGLVFARYVGRYQKSIRADSDRGNTLSVPGAVVGILRGG